MINKEKALSTGIFAIFLTGSTIIWYTLGRLAAIGVALEMLAIYLLIKVEVRTLLDKEKNDN